MPAPQLSVDTVEDPVSITTVAQNASGVNIQSVQEGFEPRFCAYFVRILVFYTQNLSNPVGIAGGSNPSERKREHRPSGRHSLFCERTTKSSINRGKNDQKQYNKAPCKIHYNFLIKMFPMSSRTNIASKLCWLFQPLTLNASTIDKSFVKP